MTDAVCRYRRFGFRMSQIGIFLVKNVITLATGTGSTGYNTPDRRELILGAIPSTSVRNLWTSGTSTDSTTYPVLVKIVNDNATVTFVLYLTFAISSRSIRALLLCRQWSRILILNHPHLHGISIMSGILYPYTHQTGELSNQHQFYLHLLENLLLMLHLRSPHTFSPQRTCGLPDRSLFRNCLQEQRRKNIVGC